MAHSGEVGQLAGTSTVALSHRAYLDGLRTVAVYLVVAFHAGIATFSGGFIGVDIFFVLSGFLVTRLLLRDLITSGRVGWGRFYSRRVRRILPAAIVTLLITALVYAVVATPAQMLDALGGFRAAFLYVANWYFIRQSTDYFAADVATNPVLHFWSLAIEEQFYLLWPLLLAAMFLITRRLGRWRFWAVRALVGAALVASAGAALHLGSTNLARAYYGTDTRVYQLLLGALLALTPQLFATRDRLRLLARAAAVVALGGLVLLGTSAFDLGAINRGVVVAGLSALVIVALGHTRGGSVERGLGWGPVAYLGRISYATYLWHWPIVVIATLLWSPGPLALLALSAGLATTFAAISYRVLEQPIRSAARLERYRRPVIALGLAASIAGGALVMPLILDRPSTPAAHGQTLDWRAAKTDIPKLPDCLGRNVKACTVVHGTGSHVLLFGDSVALSWGPTFVDIAKKESLTLSIAVHQGCPWPYGLLYAVEFWKSTCRAHQSDWYQRVIPELDPDIIVLAQGAYDDPRQTYRFILPSGRLLAADAPDFEQRLIDRFAGSLRTLRKAGRQMVIVEPFPQPLTDELNCLSTGRPAVECSFKAAEKPTALELFLRKLASAQPDVATIDVDRLVCPRLPVCDAIVRGDIVRRDKAHLTATYARSLSERVDTLLKQQHILRRN